METETIRQYVASNGKHYLFFPERVREPQPEKKIRKVGTKFNGDPCIKCNGTERYVLNKECVACGRERARLQAKRRKAKHD
ncbi:hypothetical protein GTR53_003654 [Salmonella enterica]|nr:hypothetical protein [Salmonella enterica]